MKDKLVVREVELQRGYMSRKDNPDVVPTLVCPLCVMEGKRRPDELTATDKTISGHIWCHRGCGRYSAITLHTQHSDLPLYPVAFGSVRHFAAQSQAMESLRSALQGDGDLLDMVAMDEEQPVERRSYVLPRIRLSDVHALVEVAAG